MQRPDLSIFPSNPGVYFFKDSEGKILYVGKAVRLRNRIASYFRPRESLTPKTRIMVSNAASIDILQTGTEKEALLLEASLIKKYRPRYNILLRDDKEYLLFRIQVDQDYPRLEIIRKSSLRGQKLSRSKNKFYGPFSSSQAAKETWKLLHRSFPLRRCRDRAFANRSRPCLYHYMGQCLGPCVLELDKKIYADMVRQVDLLLTGRSTELLKQLEEDMYKASGDLDYEKAARLRDQLEAVKKTVERQSVVLPFAVDMDLIGVAQVSDGLALGILFVRDGLLLDGRNFFWPGLSLEETPELLISFLVQYYIAGKGTPPKRIVVPWLPESGGADWLKNLQNAGLVDFDERAKELELKNTLLANKDVEVETVEDKPNTAVINIAVMNTAEMANKDVGAVQDKSIGLTDKAEEVRSELADTLDYDSDEIGIEALEQALSEIAAQPVIISSPQSPDEDSLLLMAAENAREAAKVHKDQTLGPILGKALKASGPVYRVEAVDISHTGGRNTRAGMVVFEAEQPVKKDYRQYALDAELKERGYAEGDDYAALYIWAERRARAGEPWPDLVLVDGGKGQLAAVEKSFEKAGVLDKFHLAAITKARDEEGFADRRAGNISDRIFLPGRSNPLSIKAGSPELMYLQRVRDTVHAYALGRHRQARSKAALSGELIRLPSVGPKTAKLLFERFGSLAAMAEASKEELMQVPGIGKARAEILFERLASLVDTNVDTKDE